MRLCTTGTGQELRGGQLSFARHTPRATGDVGPLPNCLARGNALLFVASQPPTRAPVLHLAPPPPPCSAPPPLRLALSPPPDTAHLLLLLLPLPSTPGVFRPALLRPLAR